MLSRALSADIIVKIYNDSYLSPSALKLDVYLSALKGAVWKPLAGDNGMSDKIRRSLERSYLNRVNSLLNPKDDKPAQSSLMQLLFASRSGDSNKDSDALLYLVQHLDDIAQFVDSQEAGAKGIDKLHYQDLQRQIKLIRERRTTVK